MSAALAFEKLFRKIAPKPMSEPFSNLRRSNSSKVEIG